MTNERKAPPKWPVSVIAFGAFVAIWSGWVGLGRMTGFGVVQLLPGIWDGLRLNTAISLPLGMEAYAFYALRVWLAPPGTVTRKARRFGRVSAIAALVMGAGGQVAYHVLNTAGVESAPWVVTMLVSCLPVGVLGMAATLLHLLHTADSQTVKASKPDATAAVATRPFPDKTSGPTQAIMTRTDEELTAELLRRWSNGTRPSVTAVRKELKVGGTRAARLMAAAWSGVEVGRSNN
jgi:hypothetical protein